MKSISDKRGGLSFAIGSLKSSVTKFAHDNHLTFGWQARFYDRIIRNQEEMNAIAQYIENNVQNWGKGK